MIERFGRTFVHGELIVLTDNIKVLDDDDTWELSNTTMRSSSTSSIQVQLGVSTGCAGALAIIRSMKEVDSSHGRPGLGMAMVELSGIGHPSGGVEPVINMVWHKQF